MDSIAKDIHESGLGYMYKDSLQVSVLGLVDDLIGVTEAGYQAQQMNVEFNVKSAEKCLQFGVTKCKSMLVGKNQESVINTELMVDGWREEYIDDSESGETELVEHHLGEIPIGKVT